MSCRSDSRTQLPPPPKLVDDCPERTLEQVADHQFGIVHIIIKFTA